MKTQLLVMFMAIVLINQLHGQHGSFQSSADKKYAPIMQPVTRFTPLKGNGANAVQRQAILTPILDDFMVDEDPLAYKSYSPSIAVSYYTFMIVWNNSYNGIGEIRASLYGIEDSGYSSEMITNLLINDNEDLSDRSHPDIVSFWDYLIVWTDERNGNKDIFGQFYTFRGEREGKNFQINDNKNDNSPQDFASITCGGFIVVAWQDSSSGHWDIYAQSLDCNGRKIGDNFLVNDDETISNQMFPDVSANIEETLVIVWQDNRNGNWDIYGQRYDKNMTKLGDNFKINDDINNANQQKPSVNVDEKGNFLIVWEDDRNGKSDIYGQLYCSDGTKYGNNFCISEASDGENYQPTVSLEDLSYSGNDVIFVVVWQNNNNGVTNIFGQLYSDSLVKQSDRFRVTNNSIAGTTVSSPEICLGGEYHGQLAVVWQTNYDGNTALWCQRYQGFQIPIESAFRVDFQCLYSFVSYPLIRADQDGQFTVVWENNYNLLGQSFHTEGTRWGGIFSGTFKRSEAQNFDFGFGLCNGRNFVLAWTDWSDYCWGDLMWYQIFRDQYPKRNINLTKNQNEFAFHESLAVAANDNGQCGISLVIFRTYFGLECRIAVRYFENINTDNRITLEIADAIDATNTDIAMNGKGDFIVAWQDVQQEGDSKKNIYFRVFDSSHKPITDKLKANDNLDESDQINPAVGIDDQGNFIVVWQDYRHGDADVYYQYYDATGNKVGDNQKVNDDSGSSDQYQPRIGVDANGYFVIVWEDNRNHPEIYGQLFGNSDQPIGSNYRVTNDTVNISKYSPDVCFVNDRIFYTWVDNRQGRHIFARVDEFQSTRVDFNDAPIPSQYQLYQNYPNPFNPNTTISFVLPEPAHVQVQIFDLNGREVKQLVDRVCNAGVHSVVWNGTDEAQQKVSSGIYICRLNSGEVVLHRKLILTK